MRILGELAEEWAPATRQRAEAAGAVLAELADAAQMMGFLVERVSTRRLEISHERGAAAMVAVSAAGEVSVAKPHAAEGTGKVDLRYERDTDRVTATTRMEDGEYESAAGAIARAVVACMKE